MISIGPLVPTAKVEVTPIGAHNLYAAAATHSVAGDRIFDAAVPASRSLEHASGKIDATFAVTSVVLTADRVNHAAQFAAVPVGTLKR